MRHDVKNDRNVIFRENFQNYKLFKLLELSRYHNISHSKTRETYSLHNNGLQISI